MSTNPQCPLCKRDNAKHFATANDVEYFTTNEPFSFFHCTGCDIIFIHPMAFDRLSEIYPPNYYSFHASDADSAALRIKKFLDDMIFKSITRHIPGDNLSALDIGGGNGWLLDALKRADSRVTKTAVIDIDGGAKSAALAKGHDFHLTPVESFETEQKYDLILMLNLLEHVPNPVELLEKVRGLLKPGGRIWIKTPNFDSLDARLFRNRSWGGFHTPRHFVLFTRASLVRHCEAAGFEVLKCNYTQGAPFWTVSAINELRKLGLADVSAAKPSLENSLTPLFHLAFAAFDYLRMPFSKTSQLNIHLTLPLNNP